MSCFPLLIKFLGKVLKCIFTDFKLSSFYVFFFSRYCSSKPDVSNFLLTSILAFCLYSYSFYKSNFIKILANFCSKFENNK